MSAHKTIQRTSLKSLFMIWLLQSRIGTKTGFCPGDMPMLGRLFAGAILRWLGRAGNYKKFLGVAFGWFSGDVAGPHAVMNASNNTLSCAHGNAARAAFSYSITL